MTNITLEEIKEGKADDRAEIIGYGEHLLLKLREAKPDLNFYGRFSNWSDDHATSVDYTIRAGKYIPLKKVAHLQNSGARRVEVFQQEFEELVKNTVLEINEKTRLHYSVEAALKHWARKTILA